MKMLIGDKWLDREDKIDVRNPYDNSLIDTVPSADEGDVEAAYQAAEEGFRINRNLPVYQRISILYRTAEIIKSRQEEFAVTIASEGSKTIKEARKEVSRCIDTITISAEEARRIVGETIPFDSRPGSENRLGYYYRFPIGIILAITPFNDPLNLVAHKVGPAIAGGNAVVVKPATVTPLSALKLGQALIEAGLPWKILNIITGYGSKIGDPLVKDPRPRMISFTGGTEAAQRIISQAGLKKIGMELGSNSPVIVMDDANLEQAVELSVSGAFWAVGQNCIRVQRIYIHQNVYDEFEEKFVARTKKIKVGYQLDETTDMGPMISAEEAERVERWVAEALEAGAELLTGGKRQGTLFQPTVMAKMPSGAKLNCEEVFGPVVSLYKVASLDEAISKANSVRYGLHGAIFTNSLEHAFKAIKELEVGGVMVNDSTDYRIDMMPFGGIKWSGLGREGIKFALLEMTEPKVVCFNL
ncbi:MAG: aldehyde dehydrogenase family protein [Candidatus Aminicenantales bacterium]